VNFFSKLQHELKRCTVKTEAGQAGEDGFASELTTLATAAHFGKAPGLLQRDGGQSSARARHHNSRGLDDGSS
jgi:hypothetical protein